MIDVVVIISAVGILLIYSGLTERRDQSTPDHVERRVQSPPRDMKKLAICAMSGLFAFLAAAAVTGSLVVSCALAVCAAVGPIGSIAAAERRRSRRMREGWPDVLATLVASIRAGVSLTEACIDLTKRAPVELEEGFTAFTTTYRATGDFEAALGSMRETLRDPVCDRVAVALEMAYEVGGSDLVRILRTLADQIRDDLRIRREVEARWSWTIAGARIAALAPWVVLLMMSTRPESAAAYSTSTGAWIVLFGAIATFVGYRLMLTAARLPEERRLG